MVKRRHVVRGSAPKAATTKVVRTPVEDEDFEEIDETEVDEDAEDFDDADDDDEEEEAPAPVRKAKKVVVEADEEEAPAPVKKAKRTEDAPAPKKGAEIKTVEATVVENVFTELIEALEEGKALLITKTKRNQYQVTTGAAVAMSAKKMAHGEYLAEVIDPAYTEWKEKWRGMSFDAKKKYAIKIKAQWDPHEDEGIEVMRISQAVREAEGIEKYKEEYRDRAARAALRSGG